MLDPTRPPPVQPTGIFEGLRPGAIAFGVFVDIALTMLASILVTVLFVGMESPEGGAAPEGAAEALEASPQFLFASLAVGLLCTAAGAFLGARRAGCFFARHGAWIGVGSALVGLLFYASADASAPRPPFWFDLLGFALLLPVGALGGSWAGFVARRSSAVE